MNPKEKTIIIAKEFSDTPWGRYPDDGEYCGENFREKLLLPALRENDKVNIILDGAEGFGSSFLDEAFGGIIKKGYYDKNELLKKLEIVAINKKFTIYKSMIMKYIEESKKQ